MKRTWTIIGVADVAHSFGWYQSLFGQAPTAPAHEHFGQLLDADGTVLLCLHRWGAHDHPTLASPNEATPGNGLLLFFRVDDVDADQVLPLDKTGKRLPALIKDAQLVVVEGGPHAIPWTHAAQVNTALLDFIRS